jgi:hypothetical protein
VPQAEVADSPSITRHALAGVAAGDVGELTLEGGGGGPAVQPFLLGGGGDKGCITLVVIELCFALARVVPATSRYVARNGLFGFQKAASRFL